MKVSLSERVLISIRQIIRAVDMHSRYLAKNYGLTGPQLLIMNEIARRREASVGVLARGVSLSNATVTSVLDRLEKVGYVRRNRSERDKRKVLVTLTPKGAEKMRNKPSSLQDSFISEFEKLAEWEQTLILSSIQRVALMMKAEKIKAKPLLTSGPLSVSTTDVPGILDSRDIEDIEEESTSKA
jgi:DNA-binding MarR family transcriptional regulator